MTRLRIVEVALLGALLIGGGSKKGAGADVAPKAASPQADAPKTDARYPFRTDFANADLPWYTAKPHEFPPHHSDHRVNGELVSADFIHRTGQFRAAKTGELVDFVLPPYGAIKYLNAEADLRDVPLGTGGLFFLNRDAEGKFSQLAAMVDYFTLDAGHGFSQRLDEAGLAEGKLLVTTHSIPKNLPDLGKKELAVTADTRVWKGDKQATLADLAVGDELLFNLTGKTATSPGRCTDIWVGTDTHTQAAENQRKKFAAFVRTRGLPGWIDKTEGNQLTVTLFSGESKLFKQTWMGTLGGGGAVRVCVANDELRTWNPGVDGEKSLVERVESASMDCYGSSGVRLVITVPNMLEGFRRGRVVRLFASDFTVKDQFYGESLMGYGYARLRTAELMECVPKEYPTQFPFRTDYGNAHLPWFQVREGEAPPVFSEHLVFGELVAVDAEKRTGRFLSDRTAEPIDFTLLPTAAVKHLNVDADLGDLPLGTRCRFHLYQDDRGAFTRANLVSDEFSYLAANVVTYRVTDLRLADGKLYAARQIPEVKNYNGDMERVPDIGQTELRMDADTRVWKGETQGRLDDLAVGDVLLVNVSGEKPGAPSRCIDVWVGPETHKLVVDKQTAARAAAKKSSVSKTP